jgi:hypothetical protein
MINIRRLKLKNIENDISEKDKKIIEYLINDNFIEKLTKYDFNGIWFNVWGTMGSAGVSVHSGTFGSAVSSAWNSPGYYI